MTLGGGRPEPASRRHFGWSRWTRHRFPRAGQGVFVISVLVEPSARSPIPAQCSDGRWTARTAVNRSNGGKAARHLQIDLDSGAAVSSSHRLRAASVIGPWGVTIRLDARVRPVRRGRVGDVYVVDSLGARFGAGLLRMPTSAASPGCHVEGRFCTSVQEAPGLIVSVQGAGRRHGTEPGDPCVHAQRAACSSISP